MGTIIRNIIVLITYMCQIFYTSSSRKADYVGDMNASKGFHKLVFLSFDIQCIYLLSEIYSHIQSYKVLTNALMLDQGRCENPLTILQLYSNVISLETLLKVHLLIECCCRK